MLWQKEKLFQICCMTELVNTTINLKSRLFSYVYYRESKNKTKQMKDKYEGEIEELKGQLESTNACLSTEMEEELAR